MRRAAEWLCRGWLSVDQKEAVDAVERNRARKQRGAFPDARTRNGRESNGLDDASNREGTDAKAGSPRVAGSNETGARTRDSASTKDRLFLPIRLQKAATSVVCLVVFHHDELRGTIGGQCERSGRPASSTIFVFRALTPWHMSAAASLNLCWPGACRCE